MRWVVLTALFHGEPATRAGNPGFAQGSKPVADVYTAALAVEWLIRYPLDLRFGSGIFKMTVSVSFEEGNLVVIRGSGVLKRAEVDSAKRKIYEHILVHGKIYALMLIEKGFINLEALVSWEDIEEDAVIQPNVARLALVGDWRWRDQALIFVMTAVASFQVEYFKPEQEDFARAWLLPHEDNAT